MVYTEQQSLFALPTRTPRHKKTAAHSARSGTFIDNMKLPVHRWFRYSAGFSAAWVESVLKDHNAIAVLDTFVGSGTVCIASDKLGITSYGIEAHTFVFRLGQGKLSWGEDVADFEAAISTMTVAAKKIRESVSLGEANALIVKCYSEECLRDLYSVKSAYLNLAPMWTAAIKALVFLAINSILRATSHVGTAQWQYVLPNKTKSRVTSPYDALRLQAKIMVDDMYAMQADSACSKAILLPTDSRSLIGVPDKSIDLVITSPPYANNYDYADATRLEMSFWGEIDNWGDLHGAVRKHLICSSSQHASKDKMKLSQCLLTQSIP